jgi:hypothetical protein
MREADQQNHGRLNMMIAQLHDDHDVRERENPFRPYLLARSLYEVLWVMEPEQQVADVLFEHLSNAMVAQLPDYFAAIREVFESNGVEVRLLARPSALNRGERLELARQATAQRLASVDGQANGVLQTADGTLAANLHPHEISQDILASLERMLDAIPRTLPVLPVAASSDDVDLRLLALQNFVSDMLGQGKPHRALPDHDLGFPLLTDLVSDGAAQDPAPPPELVPASLSLVARLNEYQQIAASGQAIQANLTADQNQLFALRDQLDAEKTTPLERVTIDVITSLFAFILGDEQIAATIRTQIGRLQIPFLKAAILMPELLRQENHPARQLLNRMGSVALGIESNTLLGQHLADEIGRIVLKILQEFHDDMAIFSHCLRELNEFIAQQLRHADPDTTVSIEAIEETEENSILLIKTTIALRNLLAPLAIDRRLSDFVLQHWVRVLVHAFWHQPPAMDTAASSDTPSATLPQPYSEVIAELVWSVQEKDAGERRALLQLLPNLVHRLKSGLQLIRLPEAEVKQTLDILFAMHAQILRGTMPDGADKGMSLDALRHHFSRLVLRRGNVSGVEDDADNTDRLSSASDAAVPDADTEWLKQMCVGTSIERWSGQDYQIGRLVWVGPKRTLFMFKIEQDPKPVVYVAENLIKALREGSVRLIEYAPVFDRAVESLLIGAESIQPHLD